VTTRPPWFDGQLFPVTSRWLDIDGHSVHYVDEGSGPVLLMLHGNPTWSFLYRRMISALSDHFRCVALDYPGFGLSAPAAGYAFTPPEHAEVVRRFVEALDLTDVTPLMQDWGGPVGMGAVLADPDRYAGFVVGNTLAWPVPPYIAAFSEVMGGRFTGDLLSRRLNLFVDRLIPMGMRRRTLSDAEMAMYRGPFPTMDSRLPIRVFPRQLVAARPFLQRLADGLSQVADRPSLLLWADKDMAYKQPELRRWQQVLTNRTDHMLFGAGHYWQDDAGEEASLVIRDWWGTRTA
jgi:haloalkane dehalogenase